MQNRREFLSTVGVIAAGAVVSNPLKASVLADGKLKLVLVGTGIRGNSFWGKRLVDEYSDILEFVALVDHNPGRVAYAKVWLTRKNLSEFHQNVKPIPVSMK